MIPGILGIIDRLQSLRFTDEAVEFGQNYVVIPSANPLLAYTLSVRGPPMIKLQVNLVELEAARLKILFALLKHAEMPQPVATLFQNHVTGIDKARHSTGGHWFRWEPVFGNPFVKVFSNRRPWHR